MDYLVFYRFSFYYVGVENVSYRYHVECITCSSLHSAKIKASLRVKEFVPFDTAYVHIIPLDGSNITYCNTYFRFGRSSGYWCRQPKCIYAVPHSELLKRFNLFDKYSKFV